MQGRSKLLSRHAKLGTLARKPDSVQSRSARQLGRNPRFFGRQKCQLLKFRDVAQRQPNVVLLHGEEFRFGAAQDCQDLIES